MAPTTTLEVPARKRTVRACDQCRRRKVKCNGKLGCTECNSIGLECSYGSQIKQSRRRNYLIHLEQKVQRLEHELRNARSTDRRLSDGSIDQAGALFANSGIQDYSSNPADPSISYWNSAYKHHEQPNGSSEWTVPVSQKPYLSQLLVPSQTPQSSEYTTSRADSLSPQSTSTATWTPCGEVMEYWRPMMDNNNNNNHCPPSISPAWKVEGGQWMDGYPHAFDQTLEQPDMQHSNMPHYAHNMALYPQHMI